MSMQGMEPVAIVTVLMLLQFFYFALLVGRARVRLGVKAPAVTGDPLFERYFRVQQNTMEQLIVVLPSLWLFGWYVDPLWAALVGIVFIIGRQVYLRGYVADPATRGRGFIIGNLAQTVLLFGGLIGAALSWFGS